MLMAQYFQKPI